MFTNLKDEFKSFGISDKELKAAIEHAYEELQQCRLDIQGEGEKVLSSDSKQLINLVLWNKIFKKESMGGGDVKMMFLFGLIFDPLLGVLIIFLGSIFALPMALYLFFSKQEKVIPFGPFLCVSAYISLLFSPYLIYFYWSLFA